MASAISYREYSDLFKLLGHPVRLQILDILRRSPECVCHLEAMLGRPQPYISQQLRLLREANVIADNKDGLNVFYRLVDHDVAALLNASLGTVLPGIQEQQRSLSNCPCPKCASSVTTEIALVSA